MPVRMLYLFPSTTHPVTNGAQVRANALLRHFISDLGWEVEFFCPTGSRDSSAWGENAALLRAVGDVHELDAERLAIGTLADRDDLTQGRIFEAEHVIEEDLAVVIGLGEAVGFRVELRVILQPLEAQRVELGDQVAAYPVGANQHQGPDRVDGRGPDLLRARCCIHPQCGARLGGGHRRCHRVHASVTPAR